MAHTCTTALVRCMDFRLGSAVRDYMDQNNLYDDADIISLAGASKPFAREQGSYAEGQIHLSKKLHDVNTIILMNHTDCGGYGGVDAFDSKEVEREKHLEDMRAAKEKIKTNHPDVTVKLALAVIEDDGSVNIEEIE